jgi:hypothetical protein
MVGLDDISQALPINMRVPLGGRQVSVSQKLLDHPNAVSAPATDREVCVMLRCKGLEGPRGWDAPEHTAEALLVIAAQSVPIPYYL